MTTAHKPTFHPAIGTANQGGYRYVVPRQQFSSRDLPGQLDMKLRKPGQNTTEELSKRDLLKELEEREAKYQEEVELGNNLFITSLHHYDKIIIHKQTTNTNNSEKQRQGLLSEPVKQNETKPILAITYEKELEAFDDSDDSDNSDDMESSDDEDSDLDSDDEEKLLMAELAAIKKEKAIQKAKELAEEKRLKEQMEQNAMINGNPLMKNNDKNKNKKTGSFTLKRSWTEDTVFKNQAPEPKRRKRFINDTIRSDFHRKFMDRYIK